MSTVVMTVSQVTCLVFNWYPQTPPKLPASWIHRCIKLPFNWLVRSEVKPAPSQPTKPNVQCTSQPLLSASYAVGVVACSSLPPHSSLHPFVCLPVRKAKLMFWIDLSSNSRRVQHLTAQQTWEIYSEDFTRSFELWSKKTTAMI